MLAADQYALSWADDPQTAQKRLAGRGIGAIVLDVSSWTENKRIAGREILKIAAAVPAVILPEGYDGAAAALKAFGVSPRYLLWDVLDGEILPAMIAQVVQSHRDRLDLHESEQHFAKTFQASPGMIVIVSPKEGVHVDVNDAWLSIMGYRRRDVIGRTSRELGIWVDYSDRTRLVRILQRDRKIRGFESRFRTASGNVVDVLIAGEVIDIRGEPYLLMVALDITERKKIEQTLRKSHDELELNIYERTRQLRDEVEERSKIQAALELSEQRFRDMAEAASDWFWETDAKGRFTYLSSSHRKIVGVKPSDIIGKKRQMLAVPAGDTKKWRAHAKTIRDRKPFRDFQYNFHRSGGEPRVVKTSGKPVFNENGKFVGYRGAGSDITPRVAAERREEKMRRQLVDAIEGISDALILYDSDEKFVMCNSRHREIFPKLSNLYVPGTPAKEIMQAVVDNGYVVGALDNPRKWIRERLAESKKPGHRKYQREELLQDGTWIRFNEYETSEGGRLLLVTDVTSLRQTEEELRSAKNQAEIASRAKSDFLAGMSHELRTPLNAIIGFSDVMIAGIYGEIPQKRYAEYIADINQSGIHLLNLINDILDISKIESGAVKLNESIVDINRAVDVTARFMENKVRQGGITLKKEIPESLPFLRADERRVNQILLNLVSNAVKFTPEGGEVTVGAALRPSGAMEISVSDTGIGISSDQIENVMSEFGQVDNAVSREMEGTGLGLPLTRGLMEVHGGTLEIDSRHGKGTRVIAVFPKDRVTDCP